MKNTKSERASMKNLTPNHIFFETSQPLTDEQIEKLNFFINELLFDGDEEDNIPEFTTDFAQVHPTDIQ